MRGGARSSHTRSHFSRVQLDQKGKGNDQPCPRSRSYSPFAYSLPPLLRSRVEVERTPKSKVLTARVVPTPTRHSTYVKRTTTATPLKLRDQGVLRALLTSAWTPAVKQKIPRPSLDWEVLQWFDGITPQYHWSLCQWIVDRSKALGLDCFSAVGGVYKITKPN